jgi:hypothetical protein
MSHKQIQDQIERTADEAVIKLRRTIGTNLEQLLEGAELKRRSNTRPIEPLPIRFDAAGLALARSASSSMALGRAAALAQKEAGARRALARCALVGGASESRTRCVEAFAQLVKRHPFAQRALVALLAAPPPKDKREWQDWKRARRRAFQLTTTFEGSALDEALQAWLQIFAADYTDYDYALFAKGREDYAILAPIASYLLNRRDVPNLDLALAHCSRPAKYKARSPHGECLKVLATVPSLRRLALLYDQLAQPPSYPPFVEGDPFSALLKTVIDRGKPLHPAVIEICKIRVAQGFHWRERADCFEALGAGAAITETLVSFLVAHYRSALPNVAMYADEALGRLVERKKETCALLARQLAPLVRLGHYSDYPRVPRALYACDPNEWRIWSAQRQARRH